MKKEEKTKQTCEKIVHAARSSLEADLTMRFR